MCNRATLAVCDMLHSYTCDGLESPCKLVTLCGLARDSHRVILISCDIIWSCWRTISSFNVTLFSHARWQPACSLGSSWHYMAIHVTLSERACDDHRSHFVNFYIMLLCTWRPPTKHGYLATLFDLTGEQFLLLILHYLAVHVPATESPSRVCEAIWAHMWRSPSHIWIMCLCLAMLQNSFCS